MFTAALSPGTGRFTFHKTGHLTPAVFSILATARLFSTVLKKSLPVSNPRLLTLLLRVCVLSPPSTHQAHQVHTVDFTCQHHYTT